ISNPPTILENSGAQTINLTGITAGGGQSHTLTVSAVTNNPGLIGFVGGNAGTPGITYTSPNTTGTISYAPAANSFGVATITVTVTSTGGTANGGVNPFSRTFPVTVPQVNQAPPLTAIANPPAVLENTTTPQQINLLNITAGPNETQNLAVS